MTMMALQRDLSRPAPDDFIEQLVELLALLEGETAGEPSVRAAVAVAAAPARAAEAVAAL